MTTQLSFSTRHTDNHGLYFFSALAIFVNPLAEAPKNIAMALLLLCVIVQAVMNKKARQWSGWDLFFALYMLSFLVGLPFSAYHTDLSALTDVARYTLFGWVVYRAGFSEKQKIGLVFWATFGTFVGLVYGAWEHFYLGRETYWTLNSVGHVNHAAIYNAIICGMALAVLFSYWSLLSVASRLMWIAMLALSLVYVAFGESRATFGAILVVMLVLGVGFARKSKKFLLLPAFFIAGLIAVAVLSNARVVVKQEQNASDNNVLSYRDTIWLSAFDVVKQHPLFGVGKENFEKIDINKWQDKPLFTHVSHAHNIFINVLTENGIWGAFWVFGLFGAMGVTLIRYLPKKHALPVSWLSWGAACSALVVTLVVGLVNTTFHHEHANLSMLCFALWLSQYRYDRQRFI
ncbi:O-antigen polymerase [Dickeya chrysanthemi Ech1591]|uniref:O-antigen polymerase n=1 Tax=Dickeya chrysanthemi (strain Ech1591) TaxID=561229 RepID=C6CP08_DICC1|nr:MULTISPECIES: O-antigen ligase family protein [Dickeya]ACT08751.1 O-antigen polymerase [Dickeya chrysanthemi Ech1591]TYL41903.1 O-antigen ligase family protein [Dickeya sp. ws52]WJM83798.1 O-antigen ligase family protein [Dickeya chrysanthemi]